MELATLLISTLESLSCLCHDIMLGIHST